MEDRCVIVAGGGTGGHLFPGVAVAEELARRGWGPLVFVGGERGIEARVVPKLGYELHLLPVRGLRGRSARGFVEGAWGLVRSLGRAFRILGRTRPAIVIGVGGYASVPAVLMAALRRVPIVLVEQNALPGMANRWLGRLARRVCVSFPDGERHFPRGRAVYTGNPVRLPKAPDEHPSPAGRSLRLLVFGGSAGALRLNETVAEAVALLRDRGVAVEVAHQTGAGNEEAVRARYAKRGLAASVVPFIDDMPAAYAAADLVLCRAGASTTAELTAFGKPAILVPYPYATDDHQTRNAEVLVDAGAARLVPDAELDAARLAAEIGRVAGEEGRLEKMAAAARSLGRPEATAAVADVCEEVAQAAGRRHV